MKEFKKPDYILLFVSGALLGLGILILSSVSAAFSMEKFNDPNYLFRHQLIYGVLPGLVLGLAAFFLPLGFFKKTAFWFFLAVLFLSALLLISKIGLRFLGASRWLSLGFVVFQPSEFLKLGFILYLGLWLAKQEKQPGIKLKPLVPFLATTAVIMLVLALQPDIGTLGIIVLSGTLLFFLARTPLWQNFLLWSAGAASFALLIKVAPYRLNRLLIFLNPDIDPLGKGYQLKQSLIAIGSGGLFGLGLGLSRQKFGFLPETIGDAIFPVFAEEAGFLGVAFLITLFLLLFWRGFKVSLRTKDRFSQLVGSGISFWLVSQALINICSLSGLLPLIGVPLPFVSYGGSHLVAELVGVGLLLNISKGA